jgi:hypothetical protein
MASTLQDNKYTCCQADPDVWMRVNTKPSGEHYCEFILMYVNDIMCILHDPQKVMDPKTHHSCSDPICQWLSPRDGRAYFQGLIGVL